VICQPFFSRVADFVLLSFRSIIDSLAVQSALASVRLMFVDSVLWFLVLASALVASSGGEPMISDPPGSVTILPSSDLEDDRHRRLRSAVPLLELPLSARSRLQLTRVRVGMRKLMKRSDFLLLALIANDGFIYRIVSLRAESLLFPVCVERESLRFHEASLPLDFCWRRLRHV